MTTALRGDFEEYCQLEAMDSAEPFVGSGQWHPSRKSRMWQNDGTEVIMKGTVILCLLFVCAVALPAWADCPLALRSYEDIDGRGFVLEFDPPPPSPDPPAQQIGFATLLHSSRGKIFEFQVFAASGYGRVLLVQGEQDHTAYFFAEDLTSTKTEAGAHLLFIDGLGAADWMVGQLPGSRDYPLDDPIWRLVGCKE